MRPRNHLLTCLPVLQLQRLMLRDGSNAGDAQARIDAQLPLSQKEALAQVVLHNDGDRQELQEQVCVQRADCWRAQQQQCLSRTLCSSNSIRSRSELGVASQRDERPSAGSVVVAV